MREEFDSLLTKFNFLIKFLEDKSILNEEEVTQLYNREQKAAIDALERASKKKKIS